MLVVVHILTLDGLVLVPELQAAVDRQSKQHADQEKDSVGRESDQQNRDHGDGRNEPTAPGKHAGKTVAGSHRNTRNYFNAARLRQRVRWMSWCFDECKPSTCDSL